MPVLELSRRGARAHGPNAPRHCATAEWSASKGAHRSRRRATKQQKGALVKTGDDPIAEWNKSDTAEAPSHSGPKIESNIFAAQVFTERRGFHEVEKPPMDQKDI
jgi:hypothetical protein